jgi:hypothetical protein
MDIIPHAHERAGGIGRLAERHHQFKTIVEEKGQRCLKVSLNVQVRCFVSSTNPPAHVCRLYRIFVLVHNVTTMQHFDLNGMLGTLFLWNHARLATRETNQSFLDRSIVQIPLLFRSHDFQDISVPHLMPSSLFLM